MVYLTFLACHFLHKAAHPALATFCKDFLKLTAAYKEIG